jgi:hypothetical protein
MAKEQNQSTNFCWSKSNETSTSTPKTVKLFTNQLSQFFFAVNTQISFDITNIISNMLCCVVVNTANIQVDKQQIFQLVIVSASKNFDLRLTIYNQLYLEADCNL